ncbi:MAG: long-chain fatty acid--CoA ligase [Promethearchaeota archaeon]
MYTFDWLAKQTEIRPNKEALVDVATNRHYTYLQLNERASRFSEFIRDEWGIKPGETIAILAPNSSDYIEVLYGCAKVGVILVCLNWRLAVPELEFIIKDSTPKALIYDPEFTDTAHVLKEKGLVDLLMVLSDNVPKGEWGYETALAHSSGQPIVMPPRGLDEVWHLLYTSGTTGRPKGVLQTFGMVFYNAVNIGTGSDLTSNDVTLNMLPFFHTGGLNLMTNATFHVGGTAIVQRAFNPDETLRLLSEEATVIFTVPAVYRSLSQHPNFEKTDLSRVRCWECGGEPMPVELLEYYADHGINIRQGFGMTETGPTVFLIDEEHAINKGGSVGKPQMHVAVRIVDPEGNDLPPGKVGELLVKGPGVTPGYWKLPDMTAESIKDSWLHTGDLAQVDDEGYYYIVGRLKDMFISGGENVYPAEIEQLLYKIPQIDEATVIGVKDPKWGEVGKGIIVLKPNHTLSEQDVIEFLKGKLAKYKIPKSVVFTDKLPRSAAGKVLKKELQDKYS